MKEIVSRIKEQYDIDLDKFLKLYELGYNREEIAEALNLGVFQVRTIAASLGLRLKKKFRSVDLDMLKRRLENEDDLVIKLSQDLEYANNKLLSLNRSIVKYRDENNLLRKQQRLLIREQNFIGKITKEIVKNVEKINFPEPKINTKNYHPDGLNLIVLSDLHIGAKVSKEEVGELNSYNYKIALQRIHKVVIANLGMPRQSDNLTILILGDIFDGIIHDSYLIAEMPVTKAVAQFSSYVIELLYSLSKAYKTIKLEIISGNHDRITDRPTITHKNFDFAHLFYEIVKQGVNQLNNVKITYGFKGYHLIDLPNNKKGFVFHGDMNRSYHPCKESEVLKAMTLCKQLYNVEPELLLSGHIHRYHKTLLPNGGYAITVGSLLGTNQYSYTNGWLNAIPNQVILFYNEFGELEKEKVVKL